MSQPMSKYQMLRLLGDCCNGTLDARQMEELDGLLRTDDQFRVLYCDYMLMHASLYAESTSLEDPSVGLEPTGNRERESAVAAAGDVGPRHEQSLSLPAPAMLSQSGLPHHSRSRLSRQTDARQTGGIGFPRLGSVRHLIFLAAAIVGIALVSSWVTYIVFQSTGEAMVASVEKEPAAPKQSEVVARITGTYNCLWEQSQDGVNNVEVGYGTGLIAGQHLRLREGLVEVTFNDGATVLMEGPAAFVVDASDRVALQTGRLAAVVPQHARGFRIHTRGLRVFDVSAEFGLLAHESGAAELHAFNGLVKADVLDAEGHAWRRLELHASEAARVSPVSTSILEFPADTAKFVRNMLPTAGPHDGLLAYESFNYPAGQLSAQNGGFGWAGPWFNIASDEDAGPDSNGVATGSLTTPGVVPLGNRAIQTAHQNRIRRSLATSVGGVFDTAGLVENQDGVRLVGRDGNMVYLSFVQRVSAADDGFYGLELHRGDGNPNRVLCVGNGAGGTGYGVTSNVNVYGLQNFPSLGKENTDANFFVVKITFGVDNRDSVEVFRNPVSLRDEHECSVDVVLKGNFAFDRISLGNFDGTKLHEADEIRIGTHFLAVTGRWGGNRGRLLRHITYHTPTEIDLGDIRSRKQSLAAARSPFAKELMPLAWLGMR